MSYGDGGYGDYGYGDAPYAGVTGMHYQALKKLWPIKNVEGALDDDLSIQGKYLDQLYAQAQQLYTEFFPSTTTLLLSDWERVYGLQPTGTVDQRRAAVIAKMRVLVNKDGRLTKAYYLSIASALGHPEAYIVEGSTLLFIVGVTILPHVLYSDTEKWVWELHATVAVEDRPIWEATFNPLKPAFTQLNFIYF